jgi:hypothetical protein
VINIIKQNEQDKLNLKNQKKKWIELYKEKLEKEREFEYLNSLFREDSTENIIQLNITKMVD